jgi:DNA-binding phage protein
MFAAIRARAFRAMSDPSFSRLFAIALALGFAVMNAPSSGGPGA